MLLFAILLYVYYKYNYMDIMKVSLIFFLFLLAITVSFEQSMYSVNENAESAQPVLVLSNPSSTDITVQVTNTDGSATGEYCSILINY